MKEFSFWQQKEEGDILFFVLMQDFLSGFDASSQKPEQEQPGICHAKQKEEDDEKGRG